ncbi:uncharacterized protein KGF55_001323 [Candida pseudojiufengensis]|uniref:uncharacterized protein n=1 Tax=Candida pseudojiufengensis TaxID=497109 RepID=UPI002224C1EE|nr:uncharacterized protein KGF55_001323 [Candida pseudojiufengensis]KAI5965959.1 hypothetical protein KGF55_001323 [Candida pseudojiufengensis]
MKDGAYTSLHFSNPNQAIYIEKWKHQPLTFDDIEIPPQSKNSNQQQSITNSHNHHNNHQNLLNHPDFFDEVDDHSMIQKDNFQNTFGNNSISSKILKRQQLQLNKFIDLKYNFEIFKLKNQQLSNNIGEDDKDLQKFKDLTILPNVINR